MFSWAYSFDITFAAGVIFQFSQKFVLQQDNEKDSSKAKERRPFDRDVDLQVVTVGIGPI